MPFFGESKDLPFMYKKGSLLYIRRVPFYIVEGRYFDSQNLRILEVKTLRLLEAKTYAVFQAGVGQAQGCAPTPPSFPKWCLQEEHDLTPLPLNWPLQGLRFANSLHQGLHP